MSSEHCDVYGIGLTGVTDPFPKTIRGFIFNGMANSQGPNSHKMNPHSSPARLEVIPRAAIGDGAMDTWSQIYRPYVELAHMALKGLSELPIHEFTHEEQLRLVHEFGPMRSELESLLANSLFTIQQTGASVTEQGLSSAKWFSSSTGGAQASSRRMVELGKTLRGFPLFAKALHDDKVSVDHVHVLAMASNPRNRAFLKSAEDRLVSIAIDHTVEQWRKELRALIDQAANDDKQPERPQRDNEASIIFDETGRLVIRGEFFGSAAVNLLQVLNDETSRQLRRARSQKKESGLDIPPHKFLRGHALAELLQRGAKTSSRNKGATQAILVLDPRTKLHPVRTLDGHDVDPATAMTMLCGAEITPLHVDHRGIPLNYGRKLRFASKAQQRALAIRDGGCVFPGCDIPSTWCIAHHVITWTKQKGPTDMHNLALLCEYHHGLVHSNEWDMVPDTVPSAVTDGPTCSSGAVQQKTMQDSPKQSEYIPPVLIRRASQQRMAIMNAQTRHLRQRQPGHAASGSEDDDASKNG